MMSHVDKDADRVSGAGDAPTAQSSAGESRKSRGGAGGDRRFAELGPLAGMIGYTLRRAQLAVFDEAIRGFAALGLRPAQYSVLALIGHRPGLKQSDVAVALAIQRANLVTLLDGLERRGLARRSPTPSDRRCYALHLTEAGKEVLACADTIVAGIEARLDARLGPGGHERLLDLLWRLTERS